MLSKCGGCNRVSRLPDPEEEFEIPIRLPKGRATDLRVAWGSSTAFGTPAYWIAQYLHNFGTTPIPSLALGSSLIEETAACLLGGYGISAEVAMAAFHRLRRANLIQPNASQSAIEVALHVPLQVGQRLVRYRFPRQRAERIALALRAVDDRFTGIDDPHVLRAMLLRVQGIGPKTASWIVRNTTSCESVAIIDVHIERAGRVAGIFANDWTLPRDYQAFESAFLGYATAGGVPASGLDALIWDQMRRRSRPHLPLLRYHDDECHMSATP
jgi:N-glycosylase/DNA lyase